MAARTPRQAVRVFAAVLQPALSCVTRAVLIWDGHAPEGGPYTLTFPGSEPVALSGRHRLSLKVLHNYRLLPAATEPGAWAVQTVGYGYELRLPSGRPLLAYHWHPLGRSLVRTPHVHLHAHTLPIDLTRAHLPTGVVTLTAVLRFAVTDLAVRTLRADWATVLDHAEAALLSPEQP